MNGPGGAIPLRKVPRCLVRGKTALQHWLEDVPDRVGAIGGEMIVVRVQRAPVAFDPTPSLIAQRDVRIDDLRLPLLPDLRELREDNAVTRIELIERRPDVEVPSTPDRQRQRPWDRRGDFWNRPH